jgi:hypothetical protein
VDSEFKFDDAKLRQKQWDIQRLSLERQICELQEKVLLLESDMNWMSSLAYKLINLGGKLAHFFKEKVLEKTWSPKRQAKASWRYLKHVLGYLLLIE